MTVVSSAKSYTERITPPSFAYMLDTPAVLTITIFLNFATFSIASFTNCARSGKLSGSYNSAVLAADLYHEEHEDSKQIHVFNSKSASIGETLIGLKIQELEESGASFEEIVTEVESYISSMNTFFVIETLETLRKAGRLSGL